MKKYISFWIDKYIPLDEFDSSGPCLFENFLVNLSSEYNVEKKEGVFQFKIKEYLCKKKKYNPSLFFSKNIFDLKVFIGDNGAGKTQLLKKIAKIAAGYNECEEKYVLLCVDDEKKEYGYITNVESEIKCSIDENIFVGYEEKRYDLADVSEESLLEGLYVYYSPIFNDIDSRMEAMPYAPFSLNVKNISTDALLAYDVSDLTMLREEMDEKYKDYDRLSAYLQMEHQRMNDFFIENGEYFSSFFNTPNRLFFKPMMENILACVNILVSRNEKVFIQQHFIYELQNEDGVKEYQALDDISKQKILEQSRTDFASNFKSLSLDDKFRYSLLLNYCCHEKFELENGLDELIDFNDVCSLKLWKRESFVEERDKIEEILNVCKKVGVAQKDGYEFNISQNKESLKIINRLYNSLLRDTPFFEFSLPRPLSSGERYLLKFYYRLYSVLKKGHCENIYLFIDEADTCLHPDWQYRWVERFVSGLEKINDSLKNNGYISNDLRCQIFLTTHSPFVLSELLRDNVVFLKRNRTESYPWGNVVVKDYLIEDKPSTFFAGNLFDLLNSGFFVENTIGCFAESKIKECISMIKENKNSEYAEMLISQIGDPILKELVSNLRD